MKPIKYLLTVSLMLCLTGCVASVRPPAQPLPAQSAAKPDAEASDLSSAATALAVTELAPLPDAAQQAFAQAKQQLLVGKYPSAADAFAKLLQQHPAYAGIWYNLAIAQWKQLQTEQAQNSLQQLVKLAPSYPDGHNLLGVIARKQGELRRAERHFLQALQADPEYAMAHKNLAFLYELYLGLPGKAQYHYQRYFALTGDEQTQLWLALLEQKLAQQEMEND